MWGLRRDVRFIKEAKAAKDVYDRLDEAAQDPKEYRDPAWWKRVLDAAGHLLDNFPLPTQGRLKMNAWVQKLGMVAGTAGVILGALVKDPSALSSLPGGMQSVIMIAAAVLGGSALYHPKPGSGATDQATANAGK